VFVLHSKREKKKTCDATLHWQSSSTSVRGKRRYEGEDCLRREFKKKKKKRRKEKKNNKRMQEFRALIPKKNSIHNILVQLVSSVQFDSIYRIKDKYDSSRKKEILIN